MGKWTKVLAVIFVLPVFSVFFFTYAPKCVSDLVAKDFVASVDNSPLELQKKQKMRDFLKDLQFDQVCQNPSPENQALIEQFSFQDVCSTIEHMSWAKKGSLVLIFISLIHLLLAFILSELATGSKESLLRSLGLGWRLAIAFSLVILISQAALAAYTAFYLTILVVGVYYPKMIAIFLLGGATVFYQSVRLILAKIPIESEEPTSQEVSEAAAPTLWKKVKALAAKLQTNPPDSILLGTSAGFYVTEFPIKHASGISHGRTLNLSATMMAFMPEEELDAIIGHELGHFKGDDTKMTREMTPLLMKVDGTIFQLAQGGLVAVPALSALSVFRYLFDKVISGYRRHRELQADAAGASLTSANTMALALTRYVFLAESHAAATEKQILSRVDFDSAFKDSRDLFKGDRKFWESLAQHGSPHPFDTHPPLKTRLKKLGATIEEMQAAAIQPTSQSSFASLLQGDSRLIDKAHAVHSARVTEIQDRVAVTSAKAEDLGQDMVAKHFPEVILRVRAVRTILITLGIVALLVALPISLAVGQRSNPLGMFAWIVVALLGSYLTRSYWRDWRNQILKINHIGVQLGSWKEMLRFDQVSGIQDLHHQGFVQLIFQLNERLPPLARNPIFPWRRKTFSIDITAFQGTAENHLELIYRYFTREKK